MLCYEKTVPATEVTSEEWTGTFDVQKPCERLHLRLVPASGHAELRISVGREGGDYLYNGPLHDGSRIYFGHDITPGKYRIRGRSERVNAGYTLRLYGVNLVPDAVPARSYLMMLFSAVSVIIPLLWLQKRWLRRFDP